MKSLRMTYQPTRAPEIFGDHWFNTDPISIRDLHGRPVVLFFCDRTSPQSQGLVPLFNGMHTLYYEYGLTCIGIHVPEFSFGKNPVKVEQWIHKNIILFPVVTDNERPIANAYRISAVPSICLIDNKGDIYDTIASNFIPERIERSVQYLLRQSGYRGELPILINPAFDRGYLLTGDMISEIRTGYSHGALGNPEGYSPELSAEYRDPKFSVHGKFYAHGIWRAERDSFIYEGDHNEGYLLCETDGDELCVLAGADNKTSVTVVMDNSPLSIECMGNDVQKNKKGNTFIPVEDPQLFSIVKVPDNRNHTVRLIPQKRGVKIYMICSVSHSRSDDTGKDRFVRNN
jgi:hypothetical protein